jgi:hypothetical protein
MYWLFKFSGVVGVLLGGWAQFHTGNMWPERTLSYLNLSRYWGWGGRSTRELISVYDVFPPLSFSYMFIRLRFVYYILVLF